MGVSVSLLLSDYGSWSKMSNLKAEGMITLSPFIRMPCWTVISPRYCHYGGAQTSGNVSPAIALGRIPLASSVFRLHPFGAVSPLDSIPLSAGNRLRVSRTGSTRR